MSEKEKYDLKIRSMVAASGQVLQKKLPMDFYERDADEMDAFVVNNPLEVYEFWESKSLWILISDVAYTLIAFHQSEVSLLKNNSNQDERCFEGTPLVLEMLK